jgi:hypothetical protein
MPDGVWKAAGDALEIRKGAVASLLVEAVQGIGKEAVVIHSPDSYFGRAFLELFQIKIEMQKRRPDRDDVRAFFVFWVRNVRGKGGVTPP